MSDVETPRPSATRFLPLLPLSSGVVLPLMVVPLGLESDEAKAAADAAVAGEALLVLVPRIETEDGPTIYAKVGRVAKIGEAGRLPGGTRGVVVRAVHRAILGAAVPGFGEASPGGGLFVQAQPVEDPAGVPSERARELMKEYRAVIEAILEHRHARPLAEALRGIGDAGALADTAASRARNAEMAMPAAVREAVEREIDRLERTGEQSPEHSWIRTWLDTLTELPWGKRSGDRLDLTEARAILDADHTGLDDVKERIVEHLAVRKLRRDRGLDDYSEERRGGWGRVQGLWGGTGGGAGGDGGWHT